MKKHLAKFALALLLATPALAQAETEQAKAYRASADVHCEKLKACTLQAVRAGHEYTQGHERMYLNEAEETCDKLRNNPIDALDPPVQTMALTCMRSMANLSCRRIFEISDTKTTQECVDFYLVLDRLGISRQP